MLNAQMVTQFFTQFHFIRPYWLLVLFPLFFLVWLRWRGSTQPRWKHILPVHLRDVLMLGERGWRKQLPLKLLVLIVSIAVVICAGLTWQREPSPFGEDRASMLIILDNSVSMLQKDLPPNRLERAKQKIRDLLEARNGGNSGLLVFAGSAHVAMPITQDNRVFAPFLAAITPDIMPVNGKRAEAALPLIDAQLRGQLGATVLLVSDGVTPTAIKQYQAYFTNKPYQLLILATGNPNVVTEQPMDLNSLETLARKTQGRLINVTTDNQDIGQLNRYVERNMQLNGESSMPWEDMGYALLFPVAVLMLFWFRKGWLVQWCLIIMISGSMLPTKAMAENVLATADAEQTVQTVSMVDRLRQWWWDLWLTPDQQGQRLLHQKHYLDAAKHFTDPLRKGSAYYYASEFDLAHSAFLEMQSSTSEFERDLGLYNAASALARQREYVAARKLLISLAKKTTLDEKLRLDVEHNLNVLKGIIKNINQMSESQAGGPEQETSTELGEQPQTADGVDEKTSAERMTRKTLSAEDLLGKPDLADKWLKRVEADPKYFLQTKFQIQLRSPAYNSSDDKATK
ncbi:MAG: VWA domain-containing protein [Vibrio fluvialis]